MSVGRVLHKPAAVHEDKWGTDYSQIIQKRPTRRTEASRGEGRVKDGENVEGHRKSGCRKATGVEKDWTKKTMMKGREIANDKWSALDLR